MYLANALFFPYLLGIRMLEAYVTDTDSNFPSWSDIISGVIPEGWRVGSNEEMHLLFSAERSFSLDAHNWWIRCSTMDTDWSLLWDTIKPIVARYGVACRLGRDINECLLAFDVSLSLVMGVDAWNLVLGEMEQALIQAKISRGICPDNDRPLRGSGYFSVRCDVGFDRDDIDDLDYNASMLPGIFAEVSLENDSLVPAAIMLPRIFYADSEWRQDSYGWRILDGNIHDMLCVRRAAELLSLPAHFTASGNEASVYWPANMDVTRWWMWRELTDAWLVADRLGVILSCSVGVEPRLDDATPSAAVLVATPRVLHELPAILGPFGLSMVLSNGHALVRLPGRRAAMALLHGLNSYDEVLRRPNRVLTKTLIDRAETIQVGPEKYRMGPLYGREIALVAQASAAVLKHGRAGQRERVRSRDTDRAVAPKMGSVGQRLAQSGITKVSVIKTAERPVVQRESEHMGGLAEDPRHIVKDMIVLLTEASGVGGGVFSAQERIDMMKVVHQLSQAGKVKTGAPLANYQAMRAGHGMVRHVARVATERGESFPAGFSGRANELSGRIQVRKTEGRPKTHLQLTEAEVKKLQAQRSGTPKAREMLY